MTHGAGVSEAVEVVRALVALCDLDLLYADRYRDRAEARLGPLCSRAHLAEMTGEAATLGQLVASMRGAADRTDWPLVRLLAHRTAGLQTHLACEGDLRALAEAVYRGNALAPRRPALALGGVLDTRGDEERLTAERQLRFLGEHDPEWAWFYNQRLARLAAPGASTGPSRQRTEPEVLRQAVLAAIDRTDFTGVERLLDGAEQRSPEAEEPRRAAVDARDVDRPFPPDAVREAERLGLESVALPADPGLARCLASWCRWEPADGGEPPLRANASHCGRGGCPVLGRQTLWQSLNLLMVRPCATSAATPYVPRFDAEHMLVERFAEDDLDAPSALLDLLGLSRRRGVSRMAIEDRVRAGTARACAALGLDPFEFTVAAIPFDAYVRLARARGWGRHPLWTHLDGYQLTADARSRALVGGHDHYGGADGLYAVGCDYDADRLLARFVVLRRGRFS
jgi:hypothetical protein